MTKVLLTGATGFVGQQIAKALCELNVRPVCVVRNGRRAPFGLPAVATEDLFREGHDFWLKALEGVDLIVHAAWYAEPGTYLRSPENLACLAGTMVMSDAAIRAGVSRFVGVGTCFEYDLSYGYLTTDVPLRPSTPYAQAKAACFDMLNSVLPDAGLSFAWCRLFYLHGQGEHPARLVPYLRDRLSNGESALLTSGRQIRDFLDVEIAGQMIARAALSETRGAVNICSGHGVTVAELATAIAEEYGRVDLLRFGARPDNLTDPPCVIGQPNLI